MDDHRHAIVSRERLEAGIGRRQSAAIGADDRGLHGQRGFEWRPIPRLQPHIVILAIHEDVGADLQFAQRPRIGIDVEGAGAAAGENLWCEPHLRERVAQARELL